MIKAFLGEGNTQLCKQAVAKSSKTRSKNCRLDLSQIVSKINRREDRPVNAMAGV